LTRSSLFLAVLGVLLVVAAAVVRFAVVPHATDLPEDLDVTLRFDGTYNGINPGVLSGEAGDVLLEDVPIDATRRVQAESVDGDTMIVSRTDTQTVGDTEPTVTEVRFAVDRDSREGGPAPESDDDVTTSEGLTFTLPADPSTKDNAYVYWDQATLQAFPVTFEGEDTIGDRTVYRYQSVAEGALADPAALGLPATLPKTQLVALAPTLGSSLPPETLNALAGLLPSLPEEIPISWTSATTTRVTADSELGATIAGGSTQEITGALDLNGTSVSVPFATIAVDSTDDSDQQRADDVADDASLLTLVGTVLPIVATVLGVLLLVAALLLARRAASRTGDTPPAPERTPVSSAV
jgi:hypothetical protein